MNIREYNRLAWNQEVERENQWTVPVSKEAVAAARQGQWEILLTPSKPVPKEWFPDLEGCNILCLASGGGQQGPILAAAGANVTVLDNSPRQLEQDRFVAERDSLAIATVEGDMADLSMLSDQSFDLIVHPVSNVFVPDVRPVWAEAFRVLRHGGALLAGFDNPAIHLFDYDLADRTGILQVKYALPYSDLTSLTEEERQRRVIDEGFPLEFSHTLEDQIGGQLDVGFVITGFYEDSYGEEEDDIVANYMPTFIATRAIKPLPFTFQPMNEASARATLEWHYEAPYDIYNIAPDDVEKETQLLLDPLNAYYTISDEHGHLVAYCCFGPDGQVPGGDYSAAALDIGLGVRPDLTGQGRGLTYVNAVLDFARRRFTPTAFRVTVAEFNKRALRVWKKAGFRPVQTFGRSGDGLPFVVLTHRFAMLEIRPTTTSLPCAFGRREASRWCRCTEMPSRVHAV